MQIHRFGWLRWPLRDIRPQQCVPLWPGIPQTNFSEILLVMGYSWGLTSLWSWMTPAWLWIKQCVSLLSGVKRFIFLQIEEKKIEFSRLNVLKNVSKLNFIIVYNKLTWDIFFEMNDKGLVIFSFYFCLQIFWQSCYVSQFNYRGTKYTYTHLQHREWCHTDFCREGPKDTWHEANNYFRRSEVFLL